MKRGLTYQEAIDYVGVKRRTFELHWRPRLVEIPQGCSVIFDVHDLDRLFEMIKAEAAGIPEAANDAPVATLAQNGQRNGRPIKNKGVAKWAKTQGEYSPTKAVSGAGKSTNGGTRLDFANVVSQVMKRRKAG